MELSAWANTFLGDLAQRNAVSGHPAAPTARLDDYPYVPYQGSGQFVPVHPYTPSPHLDRFAAVSRGQPGVGYTPTRPSGLPTQPYPSPSQPTSAYAPFAQAHPSYEAPTRRPLSSLFAPQLAPWQASQRASMGTHADSFPTPTKPGLNSRFSISTDGGEDRTVPVDTTPIAIPSSKLTAGPVTHAELHEPIPPSPARYQPTMPTKLKRPSDRSLRSFTSIERLRSFVRSSTVSKVPPPSSTQPSVPRPHPVRTTPATSPTQPSTHTQSTFIPVQPPAMKHDHSQPFLGPFVPFAHTTTMHGVPAGGSKHQMSMLPLESHQSASQKKKRFFFVVSSEE